MDMNKLACAELTSKVINDIDIYYETKLEEYNDLSIFTTTPRLNDQRIQCIEKFKNIGQEIVVKSKLNINDVKYFFFTESDAWFEELPWRFKLPFFVMFYTSPIDIDIGIIKTSLRANGNFTHNVKRHIKLQILSLFVTSDTDWMNKSSFIIIDMYKSLYFQDFPICVEMDDYGVEEKIYRDLVHNYCIDLNMALSLVYHELREDFKFEFKNVKKLCFKDYHSTYTENIIAPKLHTVYCSKHVTLSEETWDSIIKNSPNFTELSMMCDFNIRCETLKTINIDIVIGYCNDEITMLNFCKDNVPNLEILTLWISTERYLKKFQSQNVKLRNETSKPNIILSGQITLKELTIYLTYNTTTIDYISTVNINFDVDYSCKLRLLNLSTTEYTHSVDKKNIPTIILDGDSKRAIHFIQSADTLRIDSDQDRPFNIFIKKLLGKDFSCQYALDYIEANKQAICYTRNLVCKSDGSIDKICIGNSGKHRLPNFAVYFDNGLFKNLTSLEIDNQIHGHLDMYIKKDDGSFVRRKPSAPILNGQVFNTLVSLKKILLLGDHHLEGSFFETLTSLETINIRSVLTPSFKLFRVSEKLSSCTLSINLNHCVRHLSQLEQMLFSNFYTDNLDFFDLQLKDENAKTRPDTPMMTTRDCDIISFVARIKGRNLGKLIVRSVQGKRVCLV